MKKRTASLLAIWSLSLLLLVSGFSCATAPGLTAVDPGLKKVLAWDDAEKLPFTSRVLQGKTPNGMSYFIRSNPYPQGRIQLYLAVKSGSLQEDDDQQGLAHFLEHMAFNGTAHFPANDLVAFLESLGMRFGPEVNAYTAFGQTVFTIEIPSGKAEVLLKGLSILDDWARNISLEEKAVEDERSVINEEWRMRLGAPERLRKAQFPVILEGSRHVSRFPIGLPDVFTKATRDSILKYYRDWYRPERLALILVGDIDAKLTEQQVLKTFTGGFENPGPRPEVQDSLPLPKKGRFAFVSTQDPELTYQSLQVLLKLDPPPVNQRALYREGLLWSLAGAMLNTRLDSETSKPDCPYVYVRAGLARFTPEARFLSFTVVPKEGREKDALEAIFRLKASVAAHGFTSDEWEGEKKSLASFFEQAANQKDETESSQLADELVRHFVEGEVVPGIEWENQEVKDFLAVAVKENAASLVNRAWAGDDVTFVFSQPAGAKNPFPDEATARKMVDSMRNLPAPAAETGKSARELVSKVPQAGKIVKETRLADGLLKWELSNGMTVYLRPTDYKKDEIVLSGLSLGGLSVTSNAVFPSARHARGMASFSGLGDFDNPGLERVLKGRTMSVSVRSGDWYDSLDGVSTQADLEGLLQLAWLNFTSLRLDADAIAAYREATRTMIANQAKDPSSVFGQMISYVSYGKNPRFAPLTEADLGLIDPEAARAFLNQEMNPAAWTLSFAGTLDVEKFRGLTETWLASIPAQGPVRAPAYQALSRPQGLDMGVRQGSDPKGSGYLAWFVPKAYSYPDFIKARVFNELLDMVLLKRIREELGLVYSIGSSVGYLSVPQNELDLGIEFASDPGKNRQIRDESLRILSDLAKGKIDQGDFDKAKEIIRESFKVDYRKNSTWSRTVPQLVLVRGQKEDVVLDRSKYLEAVTLQDMADLAAFFDAGKVNAFRLEPEAKGN